MSAALRAVVVVPARDEEARIGACLRALSAQQDLDAGSWAVVVVLDACADATATVARTTADAVGLPLELVAGPGGGVGPARAHGMAIAAQRLREHATGRRVPSSTDEVDRRTRRAPVIASTDADSIVAPDWLARILAAVDRGAPAVGGRITLDAAEAAALPHDVLRAREAEASRRLAAVRRHEPDAEHHQFSGASLALTLAAYETVGGLPPVTALEDEALERALRAAGLPIAYAADVRVTTSARTDGRVPRGLAQVLRTAVWQAGASPDQGGLHLLRALDPTSVQARGAPTIVRAGAAPRGDALLAALGHADDVVLVLGPGVTAADAAPLAALLRAEPALQLVRAAEPLPDPLAELVARPALNLHAPELAVLASPLTRTWAARRELLETLALPHGDAVDLTVLVDAWARHGLGAIAERPVGCPAPAPRDDAPTAAYELLAAFARRFPDPPALSSAFADRAGTRRAHLDEHAPLAAPQPA